MMMSSLRLFAGLTTLIAALWLLDVYKRQELPGRQREVLYLKDIEGYPTREIAGMVACDEAQVRVILSRARNALRGILKKMMDDERAERTD